ncbi:MAG: hypothetical protein ACE14P_01645 [Methanotrichaceae archaeon]
MAVDISFGELTFILIGIAATLLGVFMTHTLIDAREHRKSRQDFKNAIAVVYQEIKDNMLSLNAGTHIGLMRVNTSGLDLLKIKGLYRQMPDDVLKDLLSLYWYFQFVNDVVNWELSLFLTSTLTNVDANKILEVNDKHAKEIHRRCLKEIQRTKILYRLEGLLKS